MFLGILFSTVLAADYFKFSPKQIVLLCLALVLALWVAGQIFLVRTTQMGLDPMRSMYRSGYATFAPVDNSVVHYFRNAPIVGVNGFFYAYVHAAQYLLHGPYEFFYLTENAATPTTNGIQTFYIPVKVVWTALKLGSVEYEMSTRVLRPGVFTSFFGPLVYDFGWLGAGFFSFFVGIVFGLVGRKVASGNHALLPLYLVITGFLPFAISVNLFVTGAGQFAILAAIGFAFISTRKKFCYWQ